MSPNTWFHAAGTFTSTTNAAFYNGGSKVSFTTAAITAQNQSLELIGVDNSIFGPPVGGFWYAGNAASLADLGVWNDVLTDDEIFALAQGARPYQIRPQNLVLWRPIEGLDNFEQDYIGFNTATIGGGSPVFDPYETIGLQRPTTEWFDRAIAVVSAPIIPVLTTFQGLLLALWGLPPNIFSHTFLPTENLSSIPVVDQSIPLEALKGFTSDISVPDEFLHGAVSDGGVPDEFLHGAVSDGGMPDEFLRGAVSDSGIPDEFLHGAVSDAGMPDEFLQRAVSDSGVPDENLAGVRSDGSLPIEWMLSQLEDARIAFEMMGTISLDRNLPFEFAGGGAGTAAQPPWSGFITGGNVGRMMIRRG